MPDLKPGDNTMRRNQKKLEKGLLSGKRILITGGGSGLGAAMGWRFVELGAELIICGRRLELLEGTAARMRGDLGGKVSAFRCDIRDGVAVDAMMDAIWHEAPIDILVNNAAATFIAQTEHLSFRAADAILAPTLHGTMYCTLAAGKRWIEGKHKGVVLSILSTSTITGRAFTVPSAMAKSAVLAMTRSLAVEWGPKGVRTVAIAPGAFPTPGASGQLRPEGRDEGGHIKIRSVAPAGAWRTGRSRELSHFRPSRLHQWRDGGAGRRGSLAQFRRRGSAAMDRRSVGEAARSTRQGLSARWSPKYLPKQVFPGYPSARGL
jgi:NAD(P)-dependent dehydrogenase (short-subunit alcohol dehydrogenase family)